MDFSKYQKKSGLQNEFTDSDSTKEARYGFHPPPYKPPSHLPPHKPGKWWGHGPPSWNKYENYDDYDDYWWYYEIEDHAVEGEKTKEEMWESIHDLVLDFHKQQPNMEEDEADLLWKNLMNIID